MIVSFIAGVAFGLVLILTITAAWVNKLVKRGKYASARYDEKKKLWIVTGRLSAVHQAILDIREGRKPGAIKYID